MATSAKRRIRNYSAMSESKLRQAHKEFRNYFQSNHLVPEAVQLCMDKGSGDPWRDYHEILRIAEIRMIDLED